MSWSSWATTRVGAKPVWLYSLSKDGDTAYYTSGSKSYSAAPATMQLDIFRVSDLFSRINFFEETFLPRAISHSTIRATHNPGKKQVTFALPRSDAFAQKCLGGLGIAKTSVEVWQGFENDLVKEFPRMFRGEISIVKPSWMRIDLVCEDVSSALRNKAIAAVVQRPCRHALYHGLCTLDVADFAEPGTAVSLSSRLLTVTEAAAQQDGYYSGGLVAYGQALQFITEHKGDKLSLLGAVGSLEADLANNGPQLVTIAPGCNRTMQVCRDRFSNSDNFGGFEFLTDSPFDGRSVI